MSEANATLPTSEELAWCRSRVDAGGCLGKKQLAKVFAALDDAEKRAALGATAVRERSRFIHVLRFYGDVAAYESGQIEADAGEFARQVLPSEVEE